MSALESRVSALIDDRLFTAYWDAVRHFNTKDLVLFFNEEEQADPVSALPRERVRTAANFPERFRSKFQRPASAAVAQLISSDASFWLMAMFADGEGVCVAVNGKAIAPGGNA